MIDGPTLVVFLLSCLMLSALPGPALLLVLGTAALRSTRAGILVAFGTTFGLAVHVVGVAIVAGRLKQILSARPRIAEIQQRVCGSLLLFFAGTLTATQRKTA